MHLTLIIEYYNGRSLLRKLEIIFMKRKKFLEVFFPLIFFLEILIMSQLLRIIFCP